MTETRSSRVLWTVLACSLLAIPANLLPHVIPALHANADAMSGYGAAVLLGSAVLAYFLALRKLPKSPWRRYSVFFAVFMFAAVIDALIAITLFGWSDVMSFYLADAEPYLSTGYGFAANMWDGTVHFGLYIAMVASIARGWVPRTAALFWAGSILCSLVVFMPGNLIGKYSEEVTSAIALNVVFLVVPMFVAARVLRGESSPSVPDSTERRNPMTGLLALGLLAVVAVGSFRMLAGLRPDISLTSSWATNVDPYVQDPTRYGQLYVVVAGALMVVFALIALFALRHPARASLRSWSLIMTGFATAGAFTHLAGSAYVRHEGGHVSLWAASLLPALVFGVLAWWLNRGALRPEPVRIS